MIIEFTVKNYLSFHEEQSLNMVATREQRYRDRLPYLSKRYRKFITPTASIYGANASGKTNLFRALKCMQELVLKPTSPGEALKYKPFKLDKKSGTEPTEFDLLFLADDDIIYRYFLSYTADKIHSEKLWKIMSNGDEQAVFIREGLSVKSDLGPIENAILQGVSPTSTIARFASEWGTNTGNLSAIRKVSQWFKRVHFINPTSGNDPIPQGLETLKKAGTWLPFIGAGISDVVIRDIDPQSIAIDGIFDDLTEENRIQANINGKFLEFTRESNGEISGSEISLTHTTSDGRQEAFDWGEESDGTRYIVGTVAPWIQRLLHPSSKGHILIIDELDRSLHTQLAIAFVSIYLRNVHKNSRSQLIFTTHDLMLMDLDIFRRDEIWIVEKSISGGSTLIALTDYEGIRADKDVRRSYLDGRFGGVPHVQPDLLSTSIFLEKE